MKHLSAVTAIQGFERISAPEAHWLLAPHFNVGEVGHLI
jgi:hypothetical protein